MYRIETAPTDINLVNSNCSGSKAALNFAETLNCIIDLETDVAVITQSSSAQMKRYLLPSSCPGSMRSSIKCTRRSSLRGILTDGSHIVAPGTFSCFHYKYDTSQRLSLSAEVNAAESDVQIGLRTCAGSGKFLVDNASMQEHKVSPEATKSCLGYRLEMYVSYKLWKKLDIAQKRYLWDIIQGFGDMMKAFADERNARRMHRPMRPISTRDSFRFDLKAIHTPMEIQIPGRGTRSIVKTKYFFRKDCVPQDVLSSWSIDPDVGLYPVGVVQYSGIHDDERVKEIEAHVDKMSSDMHLNLSLFRRGAQRSYHHGGKLTRTKYFLGARYLWRREELLRPGADIGKGIRVDVPRPFRWMRDVEAEFIKHSVIEASFANSFAANVYHDGSEGLGQHYDDQARFDRPIVSMRLFSDSRLSFGCKYFGMVNGQFAVDMPRGTVTVLTKGSYAADGFEALHSSNRYDRKEWRAATPPNSPQNIADAVELDLDISTRLLERLDVSSSGSASSSDVVWAAYEHDREVSNICSKVLGDIVKVVAKKHKCWR